MAATNAKLAAAVEAYFADLRRVRLSSCLDERAGYRRSQCGDRIVKGTEQTHTASNRRERMIDNAKSPVSGDVFARPADLHLDLMNPRVTDDPFEDEREVLEYLVDHADVDELVQSILSSGWLDYEPLIVLGNGNVVLEGNRRLAALRILSDPSLREDLRIALPAEPGPDALPERIRVHPVESRRAARDFIGFKHVNGPFKWDSLSKAKYAADWLNESGDIGQISRRLGDNHNTVVRLVNGWRVLRQSTDAGFDRAETTRRSFPFSHLYTALARPNVRLYLGLPEGGGSEALPTDPVSPTKLENLRRLMSWLYGQKNEPAVIARQNPNLNQLVEVLGNDAARTMLEASRDLEAAYGEVGDKTLRFEHALMLAVKQAEDTLKLVGHYDGRADIMSSGDNLRRTVLSLHGAMKEARERAEAGDADDADR